MSTLSDFYDKVDKYIKLSEKLETVYLKLKVDLAAKDKKIEGLEAQVKAAVVCCKLLEERLERVRKCRKIQPQR